MTIQINPTQAKDLILRVMRADLVPMLAGSPGVGKSQILQQIADDYNLKVIDVRLAQADPTDLNGFPVMNKETGKASYQPFDTFPTQGDPLPKGYSGWLLLMDELTSAVGAVQAAAYKPILDHKIGNQELHENVAVAAAGNLMTDNAVVEEMSTALQSRMIHFELSVDPKQWLEWATSNGIDHRITSFIDFDPKSLHHFDPDHDDKTYACPRTWEFLSRLIHDVKTVDNDLLPMIAGTVSEGIARTFLGFTRIYKDLPTIHEIEASPDSMVVPTEPSVLYALTGSISNNATPNNINGLLKFIARIPREFQVLCIRKIFQSNKAMKENPDIHKWIASSAIELF